MAYSLSPWLKPRFFITGTNRPLAGGLMYTYKAGTTDNATTYSDDAGTPNTNPIVLNSDGQCDLYLDDAVSYRLILKNSAGVTQFDKDRIASIGSTQVQSVDTIAALRLKSGTTKANAAQTLGYYAAGDGGGNSFYWDSTSVATDNSGTIIKPTSVSSAGRWLAVDTSVINIKQFGAIGDGINDDTSAFSAAVALGKSIFLPDGQYRVRTDAINCAGKDVIFVSENAEIVLTAGSSSSAFDVTNSSNVIFKGVKFSTSGNILRQVMTCSATSYISLFSITYCMFLGNVSLIRGVGSTTQNPNITPYGFKKFIYNDNEATNVDVSHIALNDYPMYDMQFSRNKVHNFSYIFCTMGLTNGSVNNEYISPLSKFVADSNIITNDDTHYIAGAATYYCVLLVEGFSAVWTNNKVSGMKATLNGTAVYDAYLSCNNIVSDNNVYKNNANFNLANLNSYLIKAKQDSTLSAKTTKVFTNNKYIIERDWLARLGETDCEHQLFNTGFTNSGYVTIKNNIFDLQTLRASGAHSVERFIFNDNVVNAEKLVISGALLQLLPVASVASKLSITNNIFNIVSASAFPLRLLYGASGSDSWSELRVNNNTIRVNTSATSGNNMLYEVNALKAFISNNMLNADLLYDYYSCGFKELYSEGNSVTASAQSAGSLPIYTMSNYGKTALKQVYYGVPQLIYFSVHTSLILLPDVANVYYLMRVEFETKTGVNSIEFKYTLNYAAGVYTVNFINSADVAKSAQVLTAAENSSIVKSSVSGSGSLTLSARFYNSAGSTLFGVLGIPTTPCKYSISISAFES